MKSQEIYLKNWVIPLNPHISTKHIYIIENYIMQFGKWQDGDLKNTICSNNTGMLYMIVKYFYRDIRDSATRNEYLYELVRNFPVRLGFYLREKVLLKRFREVGKNIKIHKGCIIINIKNLKLGNDVKLGINNYIQAGGGVYIGDNTILGPYVNIWSQNHRYNKPLVPIISQGYDYKKVYIGKDVWVGANVFIMPGAKIGDHCIISASSVVGAKNYPPNLILAGNPARKIGERK